MYIIIDAERMAVVAKVRNYQVAAIVADMDHPSTPTHALGIDGKRTFTPYTELELLLLARNGGLDPDILSSYGTLLQVVYDMVEAMPLDSRTYEQMDKKAGAKVLPSDDPKNAGKHKLPPPKAQQCAPERAPGDPAPAPQPAKAASASRTPASKGATGRVWVIADEESEKYGVADKFGKTMRSAVIARCVAEGLNAGTAATQFGKWKVSKS